MQEFLLKIWIHWWRISCLCELCVYLIWNEMHQTTRIVKHNISLTSKCWIIEDPLSTSDMIISTVDTVIAHSDFLLYLSWKWQRGCGPKSEIEQHFPVTEENGKGKRARWRGRPRFAHRVTNDVLHLVQVPPSPELRRKKARQLGEFFLPSAKFQAQSVYPFTHEWVYYIYILRVLRSDSMEIHLN